MSVFCNLRCVVRFSLTSTEDRAFAWGAFVWVSRSKQSTQGLLPASCPEGDAELVMLSPQTDGELLPMYKVTRVLCLPRTQWGLFCMAGWNQRLRSGWWTDCCLTPRWPPRHVVHCFISHRPSAADSLRRASTGGEYRFFLTIKTEGWKNTLLPPLGPVAASPLLLLLLSLHVILRLGEWRGCRETWRSAQESGAEYRSAAGGSWCPGYLAYVIDPELKKRKEKRNKNPLCLTPSPALLSLLTGICSDIISWPVLCPSHIKWWACLITIQGIFLLLLSSTAKWKPHGEPPSALFCSSPLLPSCCCQLKNWVHSALTIERESESHFTSDGTKDTTGMAEEWSSSSSWF